MTTRYPTDVTVTIVPRVAPGVPEIVINTTSASAGRAGALTAVSTVAVNWSRPHGLGHLDAGTFTVVLTCNTAQLASITWDAVVTVTAKPASAPAGFVIARGWVIGWTRRRRPSGLWQVTLTVENVIARAQSIRVGSTPWPTEPANVRLTRINTAIWWTSITAPSYPPDTSQPDVAARDVDSMSALELIERTAAPDRVTATLAGGIRVAAMPGTRITWPVAGAPASAIQNGPAPIILDAAQLGDAGRVLTRAAVVNRIAWTHPVWDAGQATWNDSTTAWVGDMDRTSSQLSMSNDIIAEPPGNPYTALATRILAENRTPTETLAGPVTLHNLTPAQLAALLTLDTRTLATVVITNCPPDLDPIQRVIGSDITITAGRLTATLELHPARLSGLRPARWTDVPPDAPISLLASLTIADTALTSA